MILNQNQQSDAQLIGDIQNNKVGIDTNNLDFITSLLTTNLYSQPIQSFIRETVANGWDSHVEAGTTDKPVILRIYSDDKYNIHIAVRDYGTGLSPERFNEIYLNIGSSTKRASNQYIGAFGLGRWTMLAVSNVCHLTNYYNGTCSKYIAYKDNAKICIDKIFESATTEENGLEVDVNTEVKKGDSYNLRTKLREGLRQLTFYDNIYIDDSEGIIDDWELDDFNNRKIADFKTFKVCDCISIKNSLLMGNVLYPINDDIIQTWFEGISQIPFAIKCNIGDVDVTPNREQLLYNQKTLDAINKSCQAALEEVKEICQTNFGSDFKTINDWYNFINTDRIHILIKKFNDDNVIDITIPTSKLSYYGLSNKVTICGKIPPNDLHTVYHRFIYVNIPSNTILYQFVNERFYVKNNRLNINTYIDYCTAQRLYLIEEPLTPVAKRYFNTIKTSHYTYYFLYKKYIYSTFRRIVKDYCKLYNVKPTNPTLKFIYQDFISNYTNIKTYGLKDVPQSFIDAEKIRNQYTKPTTAQQKARKCVIYKLIEGKRYNTIGYDSSLTSEELKKYKKTIFFAEKGNPYLEMFYFILGAISCLDNRIMLVEVAPSNLPILRELKNTIEFNSVFTEKNNFISKICTYVYLSEKWCKPNMLYYCYDHELINKENSRNILAKIKLYNRQLLETHADNELLKLLCKTYFEKGWLNYRIINTLESNIDYIKLDHIFGKNSETDNKNIIVAFYEYFIKDNINQQRLKLIKETLKPIFNEYTPNTELSHFNIG